MGGAVDMVNVLLQACSFLITFSAAVAIIVKPVREKLFGTKKVEEGLRCILRSQMLSIYYDGKEHEKKIRQYEFENFVLMYAAYKALGGNSFIDKVNKEMQEMEVIT